MDNTLYIDSNEPNNVRVAVSTTIHDRQSNPEVETKGLKTGDFVYGDTVIERKEASDLASSIKDRRLKQQTVRMLEDFQNQYLIVEGNPYQLKYSNLHDNSFIGTLVSRSSDGVKTVYTPDVEGTAYAVNKIIEKTSETSEKTEKLERTQVETEDVEVAMLACIQGISKDKAEKILEHVNWHDLSERVVKNRDEKVAETLQKVDGIGPKLAERVVKSLNGRST